MEQWDDILAELTNKVRWAITTTMSTTERPWSFREALMVASVLGADVVALAKMASEKPDFRWDSPREVRSLLSGGGAREARLLSGTIAGRNGYQADPFSKGA